MFICLYLWPIKYSLDSKEKLTGMRGKVVELQRTCLDPYRY